MANKFTVGDKVRINWDSHCSAAEELNGKTGTVAEIPAPHNSRQYGLVLDPGHQGGTTSKIFMSEHTLELVEPPSLISPVVKELTELRKGLIAGGFTANQAFELAMEAVRKA